MAEVIDLHGGETYLTDGEGNQPAPKAVLQAAHDEDLAVVLVVGISRDGGTYLASSNDSPAVVRYLTDTLFTLTNRLIRNSAERIIERLRRN